MYASNKNYLVWIIIAAIVIAGLGIWYWSAQRARPAEPAEVVRTLETATAPTITPPATPLEGKVPEVNPLERANPFNVYKNPFE